MRRDTHPLTHTPQPIASDECDLLPVMTGVVDNGELLYNKEKGIHTYRSLNKERSLKIADPGRSSHLINNYR